MAGLVGGPGAEPPDAGEFSKNFLRKLLKMHYFNIFQKNLTNKALIFRAFGRKTLLGTVRKFCNENLIEKFVTKQSLRK